MKDAIEIIEEKIETLKKDLVVVKDIEDKETVVINRTSEHLDGLIAKRHATSLLINDIEIDIFNLNKAIGLLS